MYPTHPYLKYPRRETLPQYRDPASFAQLLLLAEYPYLYFYLFDVKSLKCFQCSVVVFFFI